MTKDLAEKAILIQGKKYVQVSDRILYFNETYKNGSIITHLVSDPESEHIVIKAKVTPDHANENRFYTGHSQAVVGQGMVNKTAALENAETSAVGRALALMGIGVLDSVASVDEIAKATSRTEDGIVHEPTGQVQPLDATEKEGRMCQIHDVPMQQAVSKKTGKPYWSHRENGEMCFGR